LFENKVFSSSFFPLLGPILTLFLPLQGKPNLTSIKHTKKGKSPHNPLFKKSKIRGGRGLSAPRAKHGIAHIFFS